MSSEKIILKVDTIVPERNLASVETKEKIEYNITKCGFDENYRQVLKQAGKNAVKWAVGVDQFFIYNIMDAHGKTYFQIIADLSKAGIKTFEKMFSIEEFNTTQISRANEDYRRIGKLDENLSWSACDLVEEPISELISLCDIESLVKDRAIKCDSWDRIKDAKDNEMLLGDVAIYRSPENDAPSLICFFKGRALVRHEFGIEGALYYFRINQPYLDKQQLQQFISIISQFDARLTLDSVSKTFGAVLSTPN